MKYNKIIPISIIATLIILLIFGLMGCNNGRREIEDTHSSTKDQIQPTTETPLIATVDETVPITKDPTQTPTKEPTKEVIEEEIETPTEKQNNFVQSSFVDISTDNILFIGNSLIEGIRLCTQTNHNFLSATGISLDGLKSNIYNQIPNYNCNTVIIGMGTNELGGYTKNQFKSSYKELIQKIYFVNENAQIICLSIPPITESRSSYDTLFNNSNVQTYNNYIQEICNETNALYLDNSQFFGYTLNENWSSDGIHLMGYVYTDWYNFIISKISN